MGDSINEQIEKKERTIDQIDISNEERNLGRLEAVLFISGRYMDINELVSITGLNPIYLRDLLEKLKIKFNGAIEIVQKGNLFKMDVKQEYHDFVNKLASGNSEFSDAEQETLAIIAYKQPIKQSVIIKIRGNNAYNHIKKFIELGLVKAKKSGHTFELSLTDNFYNYFNIEKKEFKESNFS